jgi:hypothetical protein
MRRIALILLFLPTALYAQDWHRLAGDEIAQALAGHKAQYDRGWQIFYASGRTLYNAGQDSWGYWAVRGDEYCSQWPPSDGWSCYQVEARGDSIRFVGRQGDVTEGLLSLVPSQ